MALDAIYEILCTKSQLKQITHKNTVKHFEVLKQILREIATDLSSRLQDTAPDVKVVYEEISPFDVQLMFSGDVLIFSMHTNTFDFANDHVIHKNDYTLGHKERSLCGLIQVYNFLADSFRYARLNDIGYLIGRIFINAENHFFIDGNKQLMFHFSDFSQLIMDEKMMRGIIENAIRFALDFDLYAPPFDTVRELQVASKLMTNDENNFGIATGKRLGFDLARFDMKMDTKTPQKS